MAKQKPKAKSISHLKTALVAAAAAGAILAAEQHAGEEARVVYRDAGAQAGLRVAEVVRLRAVDQFEAAVAQAGERLEQKFSRER